jgi:membrane dipeptidase
MTSQHPLLTLGRRDALLGMAGLGVSLAAGRLQAAPAKSGSGVYERSIVIDAQGGFNGEGDWKSEIRESGITAISVTMGAVGNGPDRLDLVMRDIAQFSTFFANHPDSLMVALTADDLVEAKKTGRLAVILNLQDSNPLESDLSRIKLLKSAGIRTIQMTYNLRNLAGDGSLEQADAGLSKWGRQLLSTVESNKILVDISHGGRRTMLETAQAAERPLTISHTGCRALVDVPRNADDEVMREVAKKGGVVGFYFMPFLRQPGTGMAQSSDLLAHIEHALNVCGEDHIGIGTDGEISATVMNDKAREMQKKFFEDRQAKGIAAPGEGPDIFNIVEDYNTPRRLEKLAFDLSRKGWGDARIEKLLGANFLRLYRDAWS